MDRFSKIVRLISLPELSFFYVVSDQGTQFISHVVKKLYKVLLETANLLSAYHNNLMGSLGSGSPQPLYMSKQLTGDDFLTTPCLVPSEVSPSSSVSTAINLLNNITHYRSKQDGTMRPAGTILPG